MKIVILDGEMAGKQFRLPKKITRIGRGKGLEINIPVDRSISRRHAVITKELGQFYLEDLGSVNGTFLLTAEEQDEEVDRVALGHGTKFIVGETTLQMVRGSAGVRIHEGPDGKKLAICQAPEKFKKAMFDPKGVVIKQEEKVPDRDPDTGNLVKLRLLPKPKRIIKNISNLLITLLVIVFTVALVLIAIHTIISFGAKDNTSPIHRAVLIGNGKVVELLINWGNDVDSKDASSRTPLHLAIATNNKEIAELLILRGANVNIQDSQGNTPLHIAAEKGDAILTELLVSNEAKLNIKNNEDKTPLALSRRNGSVGTSKIIRNAGGSIY